MILIDRYIYFARESEDVKLPTKRKEDGCYDIWPYFKEGMRVIKPHTVELIPTGLYCACHPVYRMSLRERGSNTKWGGQIMAGQLDSGYRGPIFVAVYNSNDVDIIIDKNVSEIIRNDEIIYFPYSKAICQLAVEYVPKVNVEEITLEELKSISSERGDGALGSSGN